MLNPFSIIISKLLGKKEEEIPEAKVCQELNIKMVDALGEKIRSSSEYTGLK